MGNKKLQKTHYCKAKKILLDIFLSIDGIAIKGPDKRCKSITGTFYRNVVLKKLKKYYQVRSQGSNTFVFFRTTSGTIHLQYFSFSFLKKPIPYILSIFLPVTFFLSKTEKIPCWSKISIKYINTIHKSAYLDVFRKWNYVY